MTTVISNNVIKISTSNSSVKNSATNSEIQYPKTCDYCRDTYNSELTYNRHKETGKCFRFCRLREEERLQQVKTPKKSIYPRTCNKCSKVYKNKHSYFKHKNRCTGDISVQDVNDDEISQTSVDLTSSLTSAEIDVVELDGSNIENIPIIDKENIDDFTSNFILTLDVDKNFPDTISLYPRICEICHKVFKTQEQFEFHKVNTKCSQFEVRKKRPSLPSSVKKVRPTSIHFRRCENCNKIISHKQLYNNHIKRCGKASLSTVSVLKPALDFLPAQNTQPSPSSNSSTPMQTPTEEPSQKPSFYSRFCNACGVIFGSKRAFCQHYCSLKNELRRVARNSIYPRTCEHCEFVFRSKYQFHRHKYKCFAYRDGGVDEDDTFVSCNCCFKKFDTYSLYRQHMKSLHPEVKVLRMPVRHKYKYPRKCSNCRKVYSTRQTFCNHKKKCALDTDLFKNDDESSQDLEAEKVTYPRTCTECLHTYSNRQSFCNHRRLCSNFVASLLAKNNLYPRRCEYCSKTYSSKQTFHHHKVRCSGFGIKSARAAIYPRTCMRCNRTFAYKQSYYKHLKVCQCLGNSIPEEEDRTDDESMNQNDLDCEPLPMQQSQREREYPRRCESCRKIYANRHTYSKHKSRCIPITQSVDISENSDAPVQLSELISYPRECENCLGTFQNKVTFNAHKIRCDFFETKVNESQFKSYIKSNCEHCHNIVNQYRRIFHQHMEQCTDPIIVILDPLSATEPKSIPDKVQNPFDQANFCECCGMFFETQEQIEQHKKSLQLSEDSLLPECNVCMEIFDSEEELIAHKARCILNASNKTYPRFCECCRKVYKTKQTFYNHKKNCHVHCLKYFVLKDCDNCKLPFKCEKMYMEHVQKCVRFDDDDITAECEVSTKPIEELTVA